MVDKNYQWLENLEGFVGMSEGWMWDILQKIISVDRAQHVQSQLFEYVIFPAVKCDG